MCNKSSYLLVLIAALASGACALLAILQQKGAAEAVHLNSLFHNETVYSLPLMKSANMSVGPGDRKKSTLILHSGPHKMGTTYLQCVLQADLGAKLLKQDGFVYLGKRNAACGGHGVDFGDVARMMSKERPLHVKQAFIDTMAKLHSEGLSAIIVTESWHPLRDSQYRAIAAALAENWTIQHIFAYRPIYEWIPSFYSERFRPLFSPRYDWSGSGTKTWNEIPPIFFDPSNTWSYGFYNMLKYVRTHPTRLVMDRVTRLLPGNSSIVDMSNLRHEPGTIGDAYLIRILCGEIKATKNACHGARTNRALSVVKKSNPSYDVDADRLASAALQRGLISDGTDRTMITKRTYYRLKSFMATHNVSLTTFRRCPSKHTLDSLFGLSLEMEEQVFDRVTTRDQQERHRIGFSKEVESGRLCALDTDMVLADPSWTAFFQSHSA